MVSTFTPNRNLEKPAHNDDIDTWDVPVNYNSTQLDFAFGGVNNINVTGASGTIVLTNNPTTPPSYIGPIFLIGGTLTANVRYNFPAGVGGNYTVYNASTGPFSVVFGSAGGGATVLIPQNASAVISVDGLNVLIGGTMATGSQNTQLIYNNNGVLAGSAKLTFDGTQLTVGTPALPTPVSLYGTLFLNGSTSGYVAHRAPASPTPTTYTWPNNAGSAGAFLTTDGAGGMSWSTLTSGVLSFSGGSTGLTPSAATTGNITLAGILAIGNGGTAANNAGTARANLGVPDINGGGVTVGSTWQIHITGNAASATNAGTANSANNLNAGNNYTVNRMTCNEYLIANAGVLSAQDVIAYYSDDRLKTRLGDITDALEKLLSLDAFYYEANDTAVDLGYQKVRDVGLSAQQMQIVMPEIVVPALVGDGQYLTIKYHRSVALIIAAIKELTAEVRRR